MGYIVAGCFVAGIIRSGYFVAGYYVRDIQTCNHQPQFLWADLISRCLFMSQILMTNVFSGQIFLRKRMLNMVLQRLVTPLCSRRHAMFARKKIAWWQHCTVVLDSQYLCTLPCPLYVTLRCSECRNVFLFCSKVSFVVFFLAKDTLPIVFNLL